MRSPLTRTAVKAGENPRSPAVCFDGVFWRFSISMDSSLALPASMQDLADKIFQRSPPPKEAALLVNRAASDVTPRATGFKQWSSRRVGEWLTQLNLGEYAEAFAAHRVQGDLLELLSEEHLRELGVRTIGHRLMLVRELSKLRRRAFDIERDRVLWQGKEVLHRDGPLGYLKQQLLCMGCCQEADQYVLSGTALSVMSSEHMSKAGWWFARSRTTRTVELNHIVGVTAHHNHRCWDCTCAADQVAISLDSQLGLTPVSPLMVENGTGEDVAQLIKRAVEEAQDVQQSSSISASASALGSPHQAPPLRTMSRDKFMA